MKVILSVCSRTEKRGSCLKQLVNYPGVQSLMQTRISWDASSWYEGHKLNAHLLSEDDDVIVFVHDDLEILSNIGDFQKYLTLCNKPGVGFLGLAGCTFLGQDGVWWNARNIGASRGFVFQGPNQTEMTPNWFGQAGQVICLDGCLLACSYKTLKQVGLEKPEYLSSGWDFYDIALTFKAHLMGLNNYAVPIICRHESAGNMREDWHTARKEFVRYNAQNLPAKLDHKKTFGLPKGTWI